MAITSVVAKVFLLVLPGISGALAAGVDESNAYVDSILKPEGPNGTGGLAKVDPFHLNDFEVDFKTKVLFVVTKGNVKYHSGALSGLSNAKRKENCSAPEETKSGKIKINCTLEFPDLKVIYRGTLKYGVAPTLEIKVKTNVTQLNAMMVLKEDPNKPYCKPKVDDLKVVDDVILQSEFRGLGPVNSQLEVLKGDFEKHVQKDLKALVENGLKPLFHCIVQNAGHLPTP